MISSIEKSTDLIDQVAETNRPAAPLLTSEPSGGSARRPVLPSFRTLALAAIVPNCFAAAVAMLTGNAMLAVSVFAGLLISLVMYGGIYSFVNGTTNVLVETIGGKAEVDSKSFLPMFGLLTIGKFVLIGVLIFAMFRLVHVNLLELMVGFIIAQISVTVVCINSLKSTSVIDRK